MTRSVSNAVARQYHCMSHIASCAARLILHRHLVVCRAAGGGRSTRTMRKRRRAMRTSARRGTSAWPPPHAGKRACIFRLFQDAACRGISQAASAGRAGCAHAAPIVLLAMTCWRKGSYVQKACKPFRMHWMQERKKKLANEAFSAHMHVTLMAVWSKRCWGFPM